MLFLAEKALHLKNYYCREFQMVTFLEKYVLHYAIDSKVSQPKLNLKRHISMGGCVVHTTLSRSRTVLFTRVEYSGQSIFSI